MLFFVLIPCCEAGEFYLHRGSALRVVLYSESGIIIGFMLFQRRGIFIFTAKNGNGFIRSAAKNITATRLAPTATYNGLVFISTATRAVAIPKWRVASHLHAVNLRLRAIGRRLMP